MIQLKKYCFVFCLMIIVCSVNAQSPRLNYKPWIDTIYQNINHYFHDSANELYYEEYAQDLPQVHSYLWPLCALIQSANEAAAIDASTNYVDAVVKAIDQYYVDSFPAPAYQASVKKQRKDDRFYDDNQWIAIAYLDIYNRTHDKKFLDNATMIYHFMMTGFDAQSGGGLYWVNEHKNSKNTCSNGPGILIALQLYKITNNKHYLDTALLLYDWVNKHLQSADHLYYDNIHIPSLKIDSAKYTYNTGTMLQSAVLLYNITHKKEFLSEAEGIATSAKQYFYKNGKLPGNYWFNVVLLRGFIELYNIDHNKQQLDFWFADANRTWQDEKDANDLLGRKKDKKSLIDQAAMLETYARLQEVK